MVRINQETIVAVSPKVKVLKIGINTPEEAKVLAVKTALKDKVDVVVIGVKLVIKKVRMPKVPVLQLKTVRLLLLLLLRK
eukprot:Pgem_evm1s14202